MHIIRPFFNATRSIILSYGTICVVSFSIAVIDRSMGDSQCSREECAVRHMDEETATFAKSFHMYLDNARTDAGISQCVWQPFDVQSHHFSGTARTNMTKSSDPEVHVCHSRGWVHLRLGEFELDEKNRWHELSIEGVRPMGRCVTGRLFASVDSHGSLLGNPPHYRSPWRLHFC